MPVLSDPWADTDKPYKEPGQGVPGDVGINGNFGEFLKLKQAGASFEFGLSIGGWTYSNHFSEAVRTSQARIIFVDAIVDLVAKWQMLVNRIDM